MKLNRYHGPAVVLLGAVGCVGMDPIETRSDGEQLSLAAPVADNTPGGEQLGGESAMILGGTCARPIEIRRSGVIFGSGNGTFWRGTTEGMPNVLHPRCAPQDSSEVVFRYTVPQGVQAVEVTTVGSSFDTVLYARRSCEENPRIADTVCNDNNYDHAPRSTIFLTHLVPGESVFLVVDGNGASARASGTFVLSVRDVPYGEPGLPCRDGRPDRARCSLRLRCSSGAAADGTDLCLATVRRGHPCDPRGFRNMCIDGDTCVVPIGPEEAFSVPVCRPYGFSLEVLP